MGRAARELELGGSICFWDSAPNGLICGTGDLVGVSVGRGKLESTLIESSSSDHIEEMDDILSALPLFTFCGILWLPQGS